MLKRNALVTLAWNLAKHVAAGGLTAALHGQPSRMKYNAEHCSRERERPAWPVPSCSRPGPPDLGGKVSKRRAGKGLFMPADMHVNQSQ